MCQPDFLFGAMRRKVTAGLKAAGILWYQFDNCDDLELWQANHSPSCAESASAAAEKARPVWGRQMSPRILPLTCHVMLRLHLTSAEDPPAVKGGAGSQRLRLAGQPLAIISRDGEYPWGKSQLANPEHSDFLYLQDQLLRIHPQRLIDQTEAKYRGYRTHRKQMEKSELEEEMREREKEKSRNKTLRERTFAVLLTGVTGVLVCLYFLLQSPPHQGLGFHAAVHIKNDSLSLGSQPMDLKEIVSIHAFHADPDLEDLQINISGRHGQFKIKPCVAGDCLCNTSMPGISLSDRKLVIVGSPSTVEQCVQSLQYQAGSEVRKGDDLIRFSYKPFPKSKGIHETVPVRLMAAASASTSRLQGSLISPGEPAGTPSDLTLIAHDGLGDALAKGGDDVWVHITGRFASGHMQQDMTVRMHDNGDGTYFTSAVRPHGEYTLLVRINRDTTAPHYVNSTDATGEAELRMCQRSLERSEESASDLSRVSSQTLNQLESTAKNEQDCQKVLNQTQWAKHKVEGEGQRLNNSLTSSQHQIAELSGKLDACKAEGTNIHQAYVTASTQLETCQQDVADRHQQFELLESRLWRSENMSSDQGQELQTLKVQSEGCEQRLRNASVSNKQLTDQLASVEEKLHRKTKEVNSIAADNTDLASELSRCNSTVQSSSHASSDHAQCQNDLADCMTNLTAQLAVQHAKLSNRPPSITCSSDVTASEGEEARSLFEMGSGDRGFDTDLPFPPRAVRSVIITVRMICSAGDPNLQSNRC